MHTYPVVLLSSKFSKFTLVSEQTLSQLTALFNTALGGISSGSGAPGKDTGTTLPFAEDEDTTSA